MANSGTKGPSDQATLGPHKYSNMSLKDSANRLEAEGRGSKLNRTEVVTIRLDPRLRFIVELAARKERRTVSSFVEWCIETALDANLGFRDFREEQPMRAKELSALLAGNLLWDVEEADRFVNQACAYPETLNVEDQRLWKVIMEVKPFHTRDTPTRSEHFNVKLIRRCWPDIRKVHAGEMSLEALDKEARQSV